MRLSDKEKDKLIALLFQDLLERASQMPSLLADKSTKRRISLEEMLCLESEDQDFWDGGEGSWRG